MLTLMGFHVIRRLVLQNKSDSGGAHAATLVFLLQCRVNTRAPLKRIKTEGPLYEMQQFEITVTNPFPNDGEFVISLLHEPAEPPAPKKEPEEKKKRGGSFSPLKKKEPEEKPPGWLHTLILATVWCLSFIGGIHQYNHSYVCCLAL